MNYGIARGGNKRNFPGWDNIYASSNTAGNIKYAGHLTRRNFQPFLHVDFGSTDWQNWLQMESQTGTLLAADNDSLDVIWLNAGTQLNRIVVEHKKATPGVTASVQVYDETGATVGDPLLVDFATPGYTGLGGAELNLGMPKNGYVRMTAVTGNLATVCFTVMADLVTFYTDFTCGCEPAPCVVTIPEPDCFTSLIAV
jgi:hypothetical protein